MSKIKDIEIAKENSLRDFEAARPLYQKLVDEIIFALEQYLDADGVEYSEIVGRVKTLDSFADKIDRKLYSSPMSDTVDLAGVRVVCLFEQDLERVAGIVASNMSIIESEDKSEMLGDSLMGYQGRHLSVTLGKGFQGPRYSQLGDLSCEIQIRTVLQDAWSKISHKLVYKNEASVPRPLRRSLNNVSSLMEIAQSVFDNVKSEQLEYLEDLQDAVQRDDGVLGQPVDHHTLKLYSEERFPGVPVSEAWQDVLINDLDSSRYKTIKDINAVVERAEKAVQEFASDRPEIFRYSTDFLTKSLGLLDEDFRRRHMFSASTVARLEQLHEKYKVETKISKQAS
ncbi:GTP pyrophosphokinase family protein [Tritonibacter sp. SIMBA_163]|uniref:GTP pyrophosphokinase n=1 Tax=Tritonibacter sp. SIMBA_163 TaxID=3080868 RepID=UPI003980F0EC